MIGKEDREGKKQKKTKRERGGKVAWQGFLSCELSKDHKAELAGLVESGDLTAGMVFDVVNHSYKFGVNYYAPDENFVATFMDTDADSSFAGWMLSGWGGSPEKACISLLFKHLYVWRDGWRHKVEARRREDYG